MQDLSGFPALAGNDDDIYQAWTMCYAGAPARRVHDNFIYRDMHDGPMPIDYNLWIVRNAHRTLLVDTGFSPRAAAERNRPQHFDPVEGLERIGIDPASVCDIVLTHLHYDHAGNIDRFPNARFHVQDGEVAFATGRCMCDAHMRFPFDVEDIVNLVRKTYAERVVFHDGDDTLFPGITLHAFPGHSAAVQAVRVNTARGPVLLASDVTHYYTHILTNRPFPVTVDIAQTLASYHKALALAGGHERLIPGHDPKVRRLYPGCSINGIALSALHEAPQPITAEELARTDDF